MDIFEEETTPVGDALIHSSAAGPADGAPVVLLHGWPQDASAWTAVMHRGASAGRRMIALDLPGIARSRIPEPNGDKKYLARLIHDWLVAQDLHDVTLVGHDAGGMVAWAMLRRPDVAVRVRNVVVMDTVIPGVDPWNAVLANPYIWHFAFHSIPALPETLVAGHLPDYLDYFFDVITAVPDAINPEARSRYVEAYSAPASLRQGFEFYRALPGDAEANAGQSVPIDIPLLYLRGTAEGGEMDDYAAGFRAAGIKDLQTGILEGGGHFAPEEAPDQVWDRIAAFAPVD